ncbi:hypothetical protein C8J57DRAFT_1244200 [Mycena rebaudengoi]|nr:hypothetical protein C8J57DRAFT_1244200 [Mycena rebaudengoi]
MTIDMVAGSLVMVSFYFLIAVTPKKQVSDGFDDPGILLAFATSRNNHPSPAPTPRTVWFGSGSEHFSLNAEPEPGVRFRETLNLEPEHVFRFYEALSSLSNGFGQCRNDLIDMKINPKVPKTSKTNILFY